MLNERKDIISAVIRSYKTGNEIIFANALPSIIEGIIHDLCLLIGEDENKLLREGLKYKLDKLLNVFDYELYYEYYCFQFRLFRNKVAHGGLKTIEVKELINLLLLDLHQICKLVFSTKLKLNQKMAVINKLNDPLSRTNFKDVLKYILLIEIDVPSFYKLESQIAEIEKTISSNEFWMFLEDEIELNGDSGNHSIHLILIMLKKHNSKLFGKKCKELFKKIQVEKFDQKKADYYINNLMENY